MNPCELILPWAELPPTGATNGLFMTESHVSIFALLLGKGPKFPDRGCSRSTLLTVSECPQIRTELLPAVFRQKPRMTEGSLSVFIFISFTFWPSKSGRLYIHFASRRLQREVGRIWSQKAHHHFYRRLEEPRNASTFWRRIVQHINHLTAAAEKVANAEKKCLLSHTDFLKGLGPAFGHPLEPDSPTHSLSLSRLSNQNNLSENWNWFQVLLQLSQIGSHEEGRLFSRDHQYSWRTWLER